MSESNWEPGDPIYESFSAGFNFQPMFSLKKEEIIPDELLESSADAARWPTPSLFYGELADSLPLWLREL